MKEAKQQFHTITLEKKEKRTRHCYKKVCHFSLRLKGEEGFTILVIKWQSNLFFLGIMTYQRTHSYEDEEYVFVQNIHLHSK